MYDDDDKLKRNLFLNIRSIHGLCTFETHINFQNTQNEYKSDQMLCECVVLGIDGVVWT